MLEQSKRRGEGIMLMVGGRKRVGSECLALRERSLDDEESYLREIRSRGHARRASNISSYLPRLLPSTDRSSALTVGERTPVSRALHVGHTKLECADQTFVVAVHTYDDRRNIIVPHN